MYLLRYRQEEKENKPGKETEADYSQTPETIEETETINPPPVGYRHSEQMKTGIELIAEEREKQITKGYTLKHDAKINSGCGLEMAAMGTLIGNPGSFPADWNSKTVEHICQHSKRDRLIIAGALIAAELDRLNGKI